MKYQKYIDESITYTYEYLYIHTLGCQTHQQMLYLQVYLSFVKVIKSLKTIEMPLKSMHSKKIIVVYNSDYVKINV